MPSAVLRQLDVRGGSNVLVRSGTLSSFVFHFSLAERKNEKQVER
jgi:hypothetical protein